MKADAGVPINTDALGGLFGLALTLLFWFGRGSWSPLSAMFPNTVLVVMGALSVGLLIQSLVRRDVRPVFADGNRTRIVVTAVALLVWVWSIRYLGFYLAGLIFFTGLTLYIAHRGHLRILAAIESGDPERARRAMASALEAAAQDIDRLVKGGDGPDPT